MADKLEGYLTRAHLNYEKHAPDGSCYICSERIRRSGRRVFGWVVVWDYAQVATFTKRQWAREHIRDLKIRWIHES